MSLINDALKRASESDRSRSAQAPLPRPLQPAAEPPPRGRNSWLLAAIAVAGVGILVAGWFLWQSFGRGHQDVAAAPVQPPRIAVAESQAPAANPAPTLQPVKPLATASAPAPVVAPAAVAPDPDAWLTNLTVKAIFYSKTNPRALVNGKTVATGDKIDGVLVTGILNDRIFVDWNGQTREILMGGR